MNRNLVGLGASAGLMAYYMMHQQRQQSPLWSWYAAAEGRRNPYFRAAMTTNAKFDRRQKEGQEVGIMLNGDGSDANKSTFLCVMDAQAGFQRRMDDAGQFPREMATHVTNIYNNEYMGYLGQASVKETEVKTLYDILKVAWKRTQSAGGTRCTMIELHPQDGDGNDALLKTMKLRNADYHIVRPQRMGISSNNIRVMGPGRSPFLKPQNKVVQKNFNIPRPNKPEQNRNFKIVTAEHVLQDKDIVILASDGLWNNVFTRDVNQTVKLYLESEYASEGGITDDKQLELKSPQNLANALALLAEVKSYGPKLTNETDTNVKFKKKKGGKQDDVTVIVAQVHI